VAATLTLQCTHLKESSDRGCVHIHHNGLCASLNFVVFLMLLFVVLLPLVLLPLLLPLLLRLLVLLALMRAAHAYSRCMMPRHIITGPNITIACI
jgi:hypothetical protein